MKFKGIIFDLDQTLIDSSKLQYLRASRNWKEVLQSLNLIKFDVELKKLLDEINENNLVVGIITNSPGNYAKSVLRKFNIKYNYLVAFHDVVKNKPDPEPFFKMLKLTCLKPSECISLGDHDNDIISSQKAGIVAIGVNWYSPDYKFSVKPNYTINNFKELKQILLP